MQHLRSFTLCNLYFFNLSKSEVLHNRDRGGRDT
jgi:hypothetical protein